MNAWNKSQLNDNIKVTTYRDDYKKDFAELNLDWIEEYFTVEEMDRKYLENPRESIIDKGGEIFFVVEQQEVKGTCAVIQHSSGIYEIGKMAVVKSSRGKGLGKLLLETAIDYAQQKGANKIIIVSNTRLETAISLYKKYGFETTRLGPDPNYERGNIELTLKLNLISPLIE
jgi:GNAT superfamily N-acetyltransferase